jgi:hypothetical protein
VQDHSTGARKSPGLRAARSSWETTMLLEPALRSEERVTRPGCPSKRLTRTFQALLFPREERVLAGNPSFTRFPKEPRSGRPTVLHAIPEGATFQSANRPSRNSQRSYVPVGQPSFTRFPKEPRSSRPTVHPAIPEGATFRAATRSSRDSRRNHVPSRS